MCCVVKYQMEWGRGGGVNVLLTVVPYSPYPPLSIQLQSLAEALSAYPAMVPQLKTKKDYIHKVFTVVWADIGKTVVEENANNIDT